MSIVVPEPHLFPLVSPVSMVTVLTKDVAIMEDGSQQAEFWPVICIFKRSRQKLWWIKEIGLLMGRKKRMCIAALFMIALNDKQPKYPSAIGWNSLRVEY